MGHQPQHGASQRLTAFPRRHRTPATLLGRVAEGLRGAAVPGVQIADTRAPHLLCLKILGGMPTGRLAAKDVHVAPRLGRPRVSPHAF